MDTNQVIVRDLAAEEFTTPTLLGKAREQAIKRRYENFCIVDVDSHHYETESFSEILEYIEDPVLREQARVQGYGRGGITSANGAYQELAGRITRYPLRRTEKTPSSPHRDITLTKRWMDAFGVDLTILFPTPMLTLGVTPRVEVEVALARAYNRWLVENVLAHEPRIKSSLYLPFNAPDECLKMVEEFGDKPGVVGFMVTSPRYCGVWDNSYMKTYAALQERNLPLAFHGGFLWGGDRTQELLNRFIAVHALGFTWYNVVHLTNWICNGLPERFPKLKVIWIESGLAWLPFLMQRLDNEYMMRSSEVPLVKRKPSDYMREMYYTTQPIEMVDNRKALELTFEMIKAETQLLYASDYPHWDMDLPSTIYDLAFLDERQKRNILGDNARRVFNLEPHFAEEKIERRAARQAEKA